VEDYKKFLHTLVDRGEVLTFKEGHTEEAPHFTVAFAKGRLMTVLHKPWKGSSVDGRATTKPSGGGAHVDLPNAEGAELLYQYLKLDARFSTTNMVGKGFEIGKMENKTKEMRASDARNSCANLG
jgi:hypothetical protein